MITTTPTTTAAYSAAHTTAVPAADLAYPVQLRLPGQAGAPEGPVDPFMMYVIHHFFRRELADFAASHTPPSTTSPPGARWPNDGRCSAKRCTTTTPAKTRSCGRCCSSAATPPNRWCSTPWKPSTRSSTR